VARFQMAYLGKPASELEPRIVERGRSALSRMEMALKSGGFLVGTSVTLADVALVAYTRVAHEGGFDLSDYPAIQAWIGRVESALGIT
jgi:glutathione S-transferase